MTIGKGKKELTDKSKGIKKRIRKPGGGRKRLVDKNLALKEDLDMMIDSLTRGDPESPLRWTCKSIYKLAEDLRKKGHNVSWKTVYLMLQEMDYSMQANRKIKEGKQNPDRDAQFNFIYKQIKEFQSDGQPIIPVDAKKKENIGQYKNTGMEWEPAGKPTDVNAYDFPDKKKGRSRFSPW